MKKKHLLLSLFTMCFAMIVNASGIEKKGQQLMEQTRLIGFSENKGQITDELGNHAANVLYAYSGNGTDVFITTTGISYVFSENKILVERMMRSSAHMNSLMEVASEVKFHRTDMVLKGAVIEKSKIITARESTKSKNIFYNASNLNGIKDIKTWKEITVKDIYPGIDWVLYVDDVSHYALKYDFLVKPGANPADIRMIYEGSEISLNNDATAINIVTDLGSIREGSLLSYQINKEATVSSSYVLENNEISFDIGNYNKKEALTIDPPVIIWSTNYGGTKTEYFNDMDVDANDNLYIYGTTRSTTLPGIVGGSTNMGKNDAFVVKFSSHGELLWSAMFGGAGNDDTEGGIAVNNSNDEIYFCGAVPSPDFPIVYLEGAYNHSTIEGGNNGFIAKVDTEGGLLWSTFLGGDKYDYLRAIAIDVNNHVYLMGFTSSGDFPTVSMEGAYNQSSSNGGMNEGVLIKLDENDQLAWSTYFGGGGVDQMSAMKIDHNNHLFIVGGTSSDNFPIVEKAGAYNSGTFPAGDNEQAVIMEFNEARALVWSTFFGGSQYESARTMGWDAEHNFYVVGETESDDMPVLELPGAYYSGTLSNPVLPYLTDAFILRFDPNGSMDWSTYFGGEKADLASGISFDEQGKMWICGATSSPDFPIVELDGAFNKTTFQSGIRVMFWSMFDVSKNLDWSTFYGSDDFGWGSGLVKRSGSRMMLFTQASSDEGMSSGVVAQDPLAYTQGNLISNDIVIIEFLTDDGVGISSYPSGNQLSIFPNPVSSGTLHILCNSGLISNIKIINVLGQVVRDIPMDRDEILLNISDLNNGIYIVAVQTNEGLISKKIQISQ